MTDERHLSSQPQDDEAERYARARGNGPIALSLTGEEADVLYAIASDGLRDDLEARYKAIVQRIADRDYRTTATHGQPRF